MDAAVVPEQRIVHLPAAEAAARLPDTLVDGGVEIRIDRAHARPGSTAPGAQRFPATWSSGRASGTGYVEVGPLSAGAAVVEVALPRRATRGHAEALRDRIEHRPPRVPDPPRPRRRAALVAGVVALALVAVGVPGLRALTRPQPVTIEMATARYRAAARNAPPPLVPAPEPTAATAGTEQPVPVADGPELPVSAAPSEPGAPAVQAAPAPVEEPAAGSLPEQGVYRYVTTGWEELSVPGSRRTFPPETAQTLTHTACGFQVQWQPLEERSDTFALCASRELNVLAAVTVYRSFFGRGHEQHYVCTEVATAGGAAWSVRCDDGAGSVMDATATVQAREVLSVAGAPVETARVLLDSRLEGETSGVRRALMWFDAEGLLVRTEVASDLRVQGPFGEVTYREEHTLHLAALDPQR